MDTPRRRRSLDPGTNREAGPDLRVATDRDTVAHVLAAAADVVFSDGVTDAFMTQWVDETCFLLGLDATPVYAARSRRGSSVGRAAHS